MKNKSNMRSVYAENSYSDDESTASEEESSTSDSDSDSSRILPPANNINGPSRSKKGLFTKTKKRTAPAGDESGSDTESASESEDEAPTPPPVKKAKNFHGDSIKGVANALKRGPGGPPVAKKTAPAATAAKKAAGSGKRDESQVNAAGG
jgi:hypothetical protein